jgi:hypothetical protein
MTTPKCVSRRGRTAVRPYDRVRPLIRDEAFFAEVALGFFEGEVVGGENDVGGEELVGGDGLALADDGEKLGVEMSIALLVAGLDGGDDGVVEAVEVAVQAVFEAELALFGNADDHEPLRTQTAFS